jgi:hypothetical protein
MIPQQLAWGCCGPWCGAKHGATKYGGGVLSCLCNFCVLSQCVYMSLSSFFMQTNLVIYILQTTMYIVHPRYKGKKN